MEAFEKKWDSGIWDIPYETDQVFAERIWKAALEWVRDRRTIDGESAGFLRIINKELEN